MFISVPKCSIMFNSVNTVKSVIRVNRVNSVNSVNSVISISVNSVNSVNKVNSVNSYCAVLPPSPMVFFSLQRKFSKWTFGSHFMKGW